MCVQPALASPARCRLLLKSEKGREKKQREKRLGEEWSRVESILLPTRLNSPYFPTLLPLSG